MLKVIGFFVACWIVIQVLPSPASASKTTQVTSAEDECISKHRWDTKAVNTSRLVVAVQLNREGKGELAKYISDRDAVKMVYCSGK